MSAENKVPEVPNDKSLIDHLADAISKSGAKVQFGLVSQGHIPFIEQTLAEWGFTHHAWQYIAKIIGWDALTAACYYQEYKNKQIEADRLAMLEWTINNYFLKPFDEITVEELNKNYSEWNQHKEQSRK